MKKLNNQNEFTQRIISAQFDAQHIAYLRSELTTTERHKRGKLTSYQKEGLKRYETTIEGTIFEQEALAKIAKAKLSLWGDLERVAWRVIRKRVDYTAKRKAEIDDQANELFQEMYLTFERSLWEYDPSQGGFIKYFIRRARADIARWQAKNTPTEIPPSVMHAVRQKVAGKPIENKLYKTDKSFREAVDFYAQSTAININAQGGIASVMEDGDEFTYVPNELRNSDNTLKQDLKNVMARWAFECRDDPKMVQFLTTLSETHDVAEAKRASGLSAHSVDKCLKVLQGLLTDHKKLPNP